MHCTFCVTENDFDALEFEAGIKLLDRLVERGFKTVTFGGGEPTTWKGDVFALAEAAQHRGLKVQVGTNGIALPPDFATLRCVDRYVLPLESAQSEAHNAMRRYRHGHHATIVDRMNALRDSGKSVTVSTVITATNSAHIPELAVFLTDYHRHTENIHAWHLYHFLPLGRGGRVNAERLTIPDKEYRRICEEVNALDLPFQIFRRTDMYRPRAIEFFWSKNGSVVCGSESLHGTNEARTDGLGFA